jgi:hypothetical protein
MLKIHIDPPIQLPVRPGPPPFMTLHGDYWAVQEVSSDPRAYKLHELDATGAPLPDSIASVFVDIGEDGKAIVS